METAFEITFEGKFVVLPTYQALGWYVAASQKFPQMVWDNREIWNELLALPEVTVKYATVFRGSKSGILFSPDMFIGHIYFVNDVLWEVPLIHLNDIVKGMKSFYHWDVYYKPNVHIYDGETRNVSMEKCLSVCDVVLVPDIIYNMTLDAEITSKLRLTSKYYSEAVSNTVHGKRGVNLTKEINEYAKKTPAGTYNSPEGLFKRLAIYVKYSIFDRANALFQLAVSITKPELVYFQLAKNLKDVILGSLPEEVLTTAGWIVSKMVVALTHESQTYEGGGYHPLEEAIEAAMFLSPDNYDTETLNDPYNQLVDILMNNITYRHTSYGGLSSMEPKEEEICKYAFHYHHWKVFVRVLKMMRRSLSYISLGRVTDVTVMQSPELLKELDEDHLSKLLSIFIGRKYSKDVVSLVKAELDSREK